MPIRNFQILLFASVFCAACYFQAERMRYGGKIGSAIQLVEQNFVEEVDPDELYYAAMDGVVSKLDRFSEFISPKKYEDFQSVIEQQFGGLGILVEGPPASEQLTVIAPIPGTPAYEAGMQPGDIITHIETKSTEGLLATDATELMRGPVGNPINLRIKRAGRRELISMTIKRADIQIDSIYGDEIRADSTWDYFLEEDERIAYIRITLFGERTVQEFQSVMDTIRDDVEAVVIDLRENPGGVLPGAVELCDMLVDKGTIVSTRGRREIFREEFKANSGTALDPGIPMVVLVNENSASASEIMAGCLQDLGRAKIAGSRSYGKGTVQQVFPLEGESSALKFTTARFYRPSGKNIHRTEEMTEEEMWGITPDEELEMKISELQRLYLARRWRAKGDPRITGASEHAPEPEFAGDPQLEMAVKYLQRVLDGEQETRYNSSDDESDTTNEVDSMTPQPSELTPVGAADVNSEAAGQL